MIATVIVSMFASALAITVLFPTTPLARTLHRFLIEPTARFMHDLTWRKPGRLILSALALCFMMMMGPQTLLLMLSMGLDAAFVEVLILMYLASASGGVASTWRSLKAAMARALRFVSRPLSRRSRQRQPHRRRKSRPKGRKDDDSSPEWAFA